MKSTVFSFYLQFRKQTYSKEISVFHIYFFVRPSKTFLPCCSHQLCVYFLWNALLKCPFFHKHRCKVSTMCTYLYVNVWKKISIFFHLRSQQPCKMKECLCSSRVAANSLHTDFSEFLHTILVLYNWLLSKLAYYCQKHFGTGNFMRQSGKFDFSITKQEGVYVYSMVFIVLHTEFLHIGFTVQCGKLKIYCHLIENFVKSVYYIMHHDVLLIMKKLFSRNFCEKWTLEITEICSH